MIHMSVRLTALALASLPATALAQVAATAPSKDIVVTGRRLSDTAAALKACIARHCPPDEDIRATLAHAENQFVAGDYKQARVTLQDSAGRNRRFAKQYPVPVSDLLRASSRVDVHLGEVEDYRRTTISSLDALKAGLPASDPRVLAQRLEVADMFAQVGDFDQALDTYRKVGREAKALDLPVLEGTARLRTISADLRVAADALGTGAEREAVAEVDALAHDPDPRLSAYAFVARVMRAQYDAKHGRPEPLAVVMAEMRTRLSGTRPVLIHAEPINMPGRPDPDGQLDYGHGFTTVNTLTRLPVGSFEGQWVDVSFWIKPDGSVDDIGVLRESRPTVKDWDKPVLDSIRTRRYAPVRAAEARRGRSGAAARRALHLHLVLRPHREREPDQDARRPAADRDAGPVRRARRDGADGDAGQAAG